MGKLLLGSWRPMRPSAKEKQHEGIIQWILVRTHPDGS